MEARPRILIVGAGPTGLGAAERLEELGHDRWHLVEAADGPGGLASSVVDPRGFTWDLGGHVVFSHYERFDRMLDTVLGDAWLDHLRESWVWIRDRFVPYPFQNNVHRLPPEDLLRCLTGLVELERRDGTPEISNFRDWILASFGPGIAEVFMLPYNAKVWAYPPEELGVGWMGERVARVDLERILRNVVYERDDVAWGPNSRFRFPAEGGTGAIWRALHRRLPAERMELGTRIVAVDPEARRAVTEEGRQLPYDALLSTMPLDTLLHSLVGKPGLSGWADRLVYSGSHIVGLGLAGQPPESLETKSWIYFPEDRAPFYRATVFSNYSPRNVDRPGEQWSLLCEVSESPVKPVGPDRVVDEVEEGARRCRLLPDDYEVLSRWHRHLDHGYPTPFLGREEVLGTVEPALREMDIYSRGRFGGWKYEVSNQDHSYMQGVEMVDHVLLGTEEVTLFRPAEVNRPREEKTDGTDRD